MAKPPKLYECAECEAKLPADKLINFGWGFYYAVPKSRICESCVEFLLAAFRAGRVLASEVKKVASELKEISPVEFDTGEG